MYVCIYVCMYVCVCVCVCVCRLSDADSVDDVCQYGAAAVQVLQANVAQRQAVWHRRLVCGQSLSLSLSLSLSVSLSLSLSVCKTGQQWLNPE